MKRLLLLILIIIAGFLIYSFLESKKIIPYVAEDNPTNIPQSENDDRFQKYLDIMMNDKCYIEDVLTGDILEVSCKG